MLEDVPDAERDWHPGSDGQVLDLVHPSLFCLLRDVSGRDASSWLAPSRHGGQYAVSNTFQWLPTDVEVGEDGDAVFHSYVNNLHPVAHPRKREPCSHMYVPRLGIGLFEPAAARILRAAAPTVILHPPEVGQRRYELSVDLESFSPRVTHPFMPQIADAGALGERVGDTGPRESSEYSDEACDESGHGSMAPVGADARPRRARGPNQPAAVSQTLRP